VTCWLFLFIIIFTQPKRDENVLIVLCANICQALLANCATQLKVQLVEL